MFLRSYDSSGTVYARRDFARKMGFSGANGPHRKPPLRGGMLRMSWRYAPRGARGWSDSRSRADGTVGCVACEQ